MKKMDFNNPDTIRKFQSVLNETLERKIYESERENLLNGLGSRSIGSMASLFENISDKLFEKETGKKLIRKYVKAINENADLKKAYQFRNSVMDARTEDAESYLNEALSISAIDKMNYATGKAKLGQILREMVNLAEIKNEDILSMLNENEALSLSEEYILCNKKGFKNLSEYVKNKAVVSKYINENKKPVLAEDIDESRNSSELIGELNNALRSLNEWQRDAMTRVTEGRLSRIGDDKLFEEFKEECLSMMREKIEESDDTGEVSKLKLMEGQLSEKVYDKENFINDVMNLAELKQTLSE